MAELATVPVKHLIPYFFFRIIEGNSTLCMNIKINKRKYTGLALTLEDNQINISTDAYKMKKYQAKIKLPVEVVHPKNSLPVFLDTTSTYYKMYFKIVSPSPELPEALDLDVISCHTSWHSRTIREPIDTLSGTSLPPADAEDVAKRLEALALNETPKSRIGCYGFALRYKGVLIESEFEAKWRSALALPDPDSSDPAERRLSRWSEEREAFDVEHYLSDFFLEEDEEDSTNVSIERAVRFQPYWHSIELATDHALKTHFMLLLAGLPSKDFQLNGEERLEVLHSLFDIILAYAYDFRLTSGKHNSESAWNIAKLSATLSWFQVHRHVGDAMDSFMRRSLTFPACRSWMLSTLVYKDALEIFHLGRRQILNCLLQVHDIFDDDRDRKFLNELYIEDYLIWIQQVHPGTIKNYVKHINSCRIMKKEDAFSLLPRMEEAAIEMMKEEGPAYDAWLHKQNELFEEVRNYDLNKGLLRDDSSSDSDGSDSDSESTLEEESLIIEDIHDRIMMASEGQRTSPEY